MLSALAAVALLAGGAAAEPAVFAISPLVGDTVEAAERDSFRLFPNIRWYDHAVFLATPDSVCSVRLSFGVPGWGEPQYPLSRVQVGRIRFIIDEHEYLRSQLETDPQARAAFAAFWDAVVPGPSYILRPSPVVGNQAGRYPVTAAPETLPWLAAQGGRVNAEDRVLGVTTGAVVGSVAGGCVGSRFGVYEVEPGYWASCGEDAPNWNWIPPVYEIRPAALLAASAGMTAVAAGLGYAGAGLLHRGTGGGAPLPGEGQGWRIGCAVGSVPVAAGLGLVTVLLSGATMFGRMDPGGDIRNDPHGLAWIPAWVAGTCVSLEFVSMAWRFGHSIDRRNAVEKLRRGPGQVARPDSLPKPAPGP